MGDIRLTRWQRCARWLHRKEDRILITWCIVAGAIVLAGLLSGCSTLDAQGYEWEQAHEASAKPWPVLEVIDADLACRGLGAQSASDRTILGCAIWKPKGCFIILQANAPGWVRIHESQHCNGGTHQ